VSKPTFYLVVLSCIGAHLIGRFFANDYFAFKKDQKIGDQCYVFCFLLCVVENGVSDGVGLQEALGIPS